MRRRGREREEKEGRMIVQVPLKRRDALLHLHQPLFYRLFIAVEKAGTLLDVCVCLCERKRKEECVVYVYVHLCE